MFSRKRLFHQHHDHGGGPVADHNPPDLDPAQESLANALRGGFNVLRLLMIVLIVAYFFSGWFQVDPGEQGIIVRLGKLRENPAKDTGYESKYVFGEGSYLAWPDPFDKKLDISGSIRRLRIESFSVPLPDDQPVWELDSIDLTSMVNVGQKLTPGKIGTMVTGDRNLSHGLWMIEYEIEDAAQFVQNVGDEEEKFEPLLKRLTENAIVRTVAGMPIERVIRTETDEITGDFTNEVRDALREQVAALETGVRIVNVEARTVEPGDVRRAFLAVTDARSERKTQVDDARREETQILSRTAGPRAKYEGLLDAIDAYGAAQAAGADEARLEELRQVVDDQLDLAEGEVSTLLRRATSRASEIRELIEAEYREYEEYRRAWLLHPAYTILRRWVQMRDAVLADASNEIFYLPQAEQIEIITNRDLQRLIQKDVQRYRERYQTPGQ